MKRVDKGRDVLGWGREVLQDRNVDWAGTEIVYKKRRHEDDTGKET